MTELQEKLKVITEPDCPKWKTSWSFTPIPMKSSHVYDLVNYNFMKKRGMGKCSYIFEMQCPT